MSRRSRYRSGREWSLVELLSLASQVFAVEEDPTTRSLSSHQKWSIVADSLSRSPHQCRAQWDSLLSLHASVRASPAPYWSLDPPTRSSLGLPEDFPRDVFVFVEDLLVENGRRQREREVVEDDEEEDPPLLMPPPPDRSQDDDASQEVSSDNEHDDIMKRLEENGGDIQNYVERIESILKGKLPEGVRMCSFSRYEDYIRTRSSTCETKSYSAETLFARRQADELIKVFQNLISTLEQMK